MSRYRAFLFSTLFKLLLDHLILIFQSVLILKQIRKHVVENKALNIY